MIIALAQINPIVGDLTGNAEKIITQARNARSVGADLVVYPELAVSGYPPMDLLDKPYFLEAVNATVDYIATEIPQDLGVLIGAPLPNPSKHGHRAINAAVLLENGERIATVQKMLLPTYDVFDERRYFEPANSQDIVVWRNHRLGIHICEDMWNHADYSPVLYENDPVEALADQNPDIFINISASPYSVGKHEMRDDIIQRACRLYNKPFVLVNQIGANTEVLFDGCSRVFDPSGKLVCTAKAFDEDLVYWDSEVKGIEQSTNEQDDIADLHDALVMGIRDYFNKTGFFRKALIGLSGGIDSAVTCALAVNALGADKVHGVTMPSKYSSSGSVDDSVLLAEAAGINIETIAIPPAVDAVEQMLGPIFEGTSPGVAEENIQARIRGVTLMAISNKFNDLLLTTGNKSEMAVGYATLYGDMSGGLAVLSDVFKMDVYRLAEYINERAGRDVIPRNTITKPPSAELRPDQKDTDSLPDYPVLDHILSLYVEELLEVDAIANKTGYDAELVAEILRKVDQNEYKRRQAPPGLRVSFKAFGIGRRLPIVMRWHRDGIRGILQKEVI